MTTVNSNVTMCNTTFVICVESGMLEYKALCLILSLRKYGGRWCDCHIVSYSPRKGRQVSLWLKKIYRKYNVTVVDDVLNKSWDDYPLANKPISMCDAESRCTTEYIIFLDSDILVWDEPKCLEIPQNKDLAGVIDADKSVASSGVDDDFDEMWLRLYANAGVENEVFRITTLSQEVVRGWWCSGVIVARRTKGYMHEWFKIFESAFETDIFSSRATYLREQMTFSVLATKHINSFEDLSPICNYHVQNQDKYIDVHMLEADDACIWHYQCYFDKAFTGFKKKLDREDSIDNKINIAWNFINKLHENHAKMIGIDESWLNSIRRRLRIGVTLRRLLGIQKESDKYV